MNFLWNLDLLEKLLHEYKDKDILEFLRYGWPINHNGSTGSTVIPQNWPGAVENKSDIKNYFEKEIANNAVLGPFDGNPFSYNAFLSPLNKRDIKDCLEKNNYWGHVFPKRQQC